MLLCRFLRFPFHHKTRKPIPHVACLSFQLLCFLFLLFAPQADFKRILHLLDHLLAGIPLDAVHIRLFDDLPLFFLVQIDISQYIIPLSRFTQITVHTMPDAVFVCVDWGSNRQRPDSTGLKEFQL